MRVIFFALAVLLCSISGRRVHFADDKSEDDLRNGQSRQASHVEALSGLVTQLIAHDRMASRFSRLHPRTDLSEALRQRGGAESKLSETDVVAEALRASLSSITRTAPDWNLFSDDVKIVLADASTLQGLANLKQIWSFFNSICKNFKVHSSIELNRQSKKGWRGNSYSAKIPLASKWQIEVGDRKGLFAQRKNALTLIEGEVTFHFGKKGLVDRIEITQLRKNLEPIEKWPRTDLSDTTVKNLEKFLERAVPQSAQAARAYLKQQIADETNLAEVGMANLQKAMEDPEMFKQLMSLIEDSETMAMINDLISKDPSFRKQVEQVPDEDIDKLVSNAKFEKLELAMTDRSKRSSRLVPWAFR